MPSVPPMPFLTGPPKRASSWPLGELSAPGVLARAGSAASRHKASGSDPRWPGLTEFVGKNNTAEWHAPDSMAGMSAAIATVRQRFADLPLLFSFVNKQVDYLGRDLSQFDLLEYHIWMAQQNDGEFYQEVGYGYELFDPKGYNNMSRNAECAYRARPAYWQKLLTDKIDRTAKVSAQLNKPLITTECWALVDYKDWPLLKWDG